MDGGREGSLLPDFSLYPVWHKEAQCHMLPQPRTRTGGGRDLSLCSRHS